ncbi:MAG: phosphate ABC transporter, permease protein PstA, partial [Chloroflexi bacterium]|nr:phosphate ABC transporter, permease protein PstA [Chloroflexota bacterium]
MNRQQSQKVAKVVVTMIAALVMAPIALVILYVVVSGISVINWEFFTAAPRNGMT